MTAWFESVCDTCCDYKSVTLIEDRKACHNCLVERYDEDGDLRERIDTGDLVFKNDDDRIPKGEN